jgi:S-DNA-T family DNA segregation ATPase FtsK/SpoIIIE
LYEAAVDVVVREGRGSVSLLQRALGIGYGRTARLVDYMAEDGIVGNYNGSQAREVMLTLEQWAEMNGQKEAAPTPPPRSGRVLTVSSRSTPQIDDEEDDEFTSGELDHEDEDDADSDDGEFEEEEEADEGDAADDEADEEGLDEKDAGPRYRRGRESA